jgi:hypothetical protein
MERLSEKKTGIFSLGEKENLSIAKATVLFYFDDQR